MDGIPLTGLSPLHFCACLKPGPRYPTSYIKVIFIFNERWLFILWCWNCRRLKLSFQSYIKDPLPFKHTWHLENRISYNKSAEILLDRTFSEKFNEKKHTNLTLLVILGNDPIFGQRWCQDQKKEICVFTVTQPTLIFASDPMNFYTEFG